MYRKSANVTVTDLAAGAEEIYSITDAKARVGDVIVANEPAGGAEASWGIVQAWVDSVGVIKVKAGNFHASDALTGGTVAIRYAVLR